MANNDNNPRRDASRPEDNPFIAFRRFADSQVSSLFNTVFTLPATMANYNNVHQAREQCLFGKADKRQCDRLHETEAMIAELRHQERELFRVGDVQTGLATREQIVMFDRRADELRRDIVEDAVPKDRRMLKSQTDAELTERVANKKGQEWGWSWDWGFPRPFDHDNNRAEGATDANEARQTAQATELMLRLESELKTLMGEKTYDDAMAALTNVFHANGMPTNIDAKAWNEARVEDAKHLTDQDPRNETREPRVWTWSRSWQWPPPADASRSDDMAYSPRVLENDHEMKKAGVQWQEAYEDLLRSERRERPHCMRSEAPVASEHNCGTSLFPNPRWVHGTNKEPKWVSSEDRAARDEPSYEYSHDHEDQHDDPPTPKVDRFEKLPGKDDQDEAAWEDRQAQKFWEQKQEETREYLAQYEKDTKVDAGVHESVEQEAETELDAYERLEAAPKTSGSTVPPTVPAKPDITDSAKPSILSTLTTTERTIAPDGSVTTKVVLKKRFADGRVEKRTTIHKQGGQEAGVDKSLQVPQTAGPGVQALSTRMDNENRRGAEREMVKKNGWFWSS